MTKKRLEFKLLGWHIIITMSTYPYGFKRKKEPVVDANQTELELKV